MHELKCYYNLCMSAGRIIKRKVYFFFAFGKTKVTYEPKQHRWNFQFSVTNRFVSLLLPFFSTVSLLHLSFKPGHAIVLPGLVNIRHVLLFSPVTDSNPCILTLVRTTPFWASTKYQTFFCCNGWRRGAERGQQLTMSNTRNFSIRIPGVCMVYSSVDFIWHGSAAIFKKGRKKLMLTHRRAKSEKSWATSRPTNCMYFRHTSFELHIFLYIKILNAHSEIVFPSIRRIRQRLYGPPHLSPILFASLWTVEKIMIHR